jgi:electron transfer flavoprotein alpha subunit
MRRILVIVERARGGVDDSAWELLTAARTLAGADGRVAAALCGQGVGALAQDLARGFDEVFVFDDPRLATPDGEADGLALRALCGRERFDAILAAHTNVTVDLAPALSVALGVPLLADCIALEWRGQQLAAVRAVYGGKVHARVVTAPSAQGALATVRGGAFAAAERAGAAAGKVQAEALPADFAPRRRNVRTLEPESGAVDISQADVLVAVGRGIEEKDNLEVVQPLVEALKAELCCSRPVVDKGWLPKSRQVGTSGVSVRPRIYLAVGISGSFQHLGGIKGSPFLVAINKDRGAPIFGQADVGVVGDLFEVVPALVEEIHKAKG